MPTTYYEGISSPDGHVTLLTGHLTANGWTYDGTNTVYTSPTVDGRTINLRFTQGTNVLQIDWRLVAGSGSGATNQKSFFLYHHGTGTNPTRFKAWVSDTFYFLQIEGPYAGETGTYSGSIGSPMNSFGVFPLVPYSVDDTAKPLVGLGNATSGVSDTTNDVFTSRNRGATGFFMPGRLHNMRPTIQDFASAGDISRQKFTEGQITWHSFAVVDDVDGFRGWLRGVAFGSDAYNQSGDLAGAVQINDRCTIGGKTWRPTYSRKSVTTGGNPFGYTSSSNTFGPVIALESS
jgi:hypothetical protein